MTAPAPSSPAPFGETDEAARRVPGFDPLSVAVGIVVVIVLVAGLVWSAATGQATSARHPQLFGGSLVLDDDRPLTVVQLATAEATVQLAGVYAQVGGTSYEQVQAVPVSGGTFLVNRSTGTFNLLGADNYVVDPTGGGVGLGPLAGSHTAAGFADGASAYIVRYGPHATVSLVDAATVAEAASASTRSTSKAPTRVVPRGFAALAGPVTRAAGGSVVAGGDLWTLEHDGATCALERLRPVASGDDGLVAAQVASGFPCAAAVLSTAGPLVGLARPGHVTLFPVAGGSRPITVTGVAAATAMLPVTGTVSALWWLARLPSGWAALGVTSGGVASLHALTGIPAAAEPAAPVLSAGRIYTLARNGPGQPELWVVDPATGAVGTLAGVPRYPARSRSEKASFTGAEVVGRGPRVVFNNPDSLLAVVVFTDGSHAPVVVDKSSAVDVSATGPASINATDKAPGAKHARAHSTATGKNRRTRATPTVNEQFTCANSTQKPYAPQVQPVTPSSESALVSWTYTLLDEQDCEPDTYLVRIRALGGAPAPAQTEVVVEGQTQAQITGLRPTTTYSVVVAALIGTQSTASPPVTFKTTARGPDAPTSVTTSVLADGDWLVSWTPCRAGTCYVPADVWDITATACGGSFAGQPPNTEVGGAATSVEIDAAAEGLLGTSMSFSVEGALASGLRGNPTSDHTCTQSWRPPARSQISVSDSATVTGGSVTATVDVSPTTGSPDAALTYGSQDTVFTYTVGGQSHTVTNGTTFSVPGLLPGHSYPVSVSIAPAGHPQASVVLRGQTLLQHEAWPAITPSVPTPTVSPDELRGFVHVTFPSGLPADDSYDVAGGLTCGEDDHTFSQDIQGLSFEFVVGDLDTFGGDCSLTIASLTDLTAGNPFGSVRSSPSAAVSVGFPPAPQYSYTARYGDYSCAGVLTCPDVSVRDLTIPEPGDQWSVQVLGNGDGLDGQTCSPTYPERPGYVHPLVIELPLGCSGSVSVSVSWQYYGTRMGPVTVSPTGTAPTTTTSTSTTTTSTSSTSTTTTATGPSTTAGSSTTASGAARTAATALVGASGPAGPPGDGAGELTLELLVAALLLASAGVTLVGRRSRRGHAGAAEGALGPTRQRKGHT